MVEMFSVIIPAYNEEATIANTIEVLVTAMGENRGLFEIIVVDAGSRDNTSDIAGSLLKSEGMSGSIIKIPYPAMPGKARNEGIRNARHENIILVDSGVGMTKQAMDECISSAGAYDFIWFKSEFRFSDCIEASYVRPYFVYRENGRYIRHCMVKKEVFENLGYFNEELRAGEDWVFYKKVAAGGFREFFSSTKVYCSGFPASLSGFAAKWKIYFENSVYAGFGLRNIRTSLVQLLVFLVLVMALYLSGAAWYISIPGSALAFAVTRGLLSFVRSRIKPFSAVDFLYTLMTSVVLEICRVTGTVKGYACNERK